MSYMD